jgi:hypothetical protein
VSIEDNTLVESPGPRDSIEESDAEEDHGPPPVAPSHETPPVSPTRRDFMEGTVQPKSRDINRFYSFSGDPHKGKLPDSQPVVTDDESIQGSKNNVMDELGRRLSIVRGTFDERMATIEALSPPPPAAPTTSTSPPVSAQPPLSPPPNFMQEAIEQLNTYKKRRESNATTIDEESSVGFQDTDSQKLYTASTDQRGGESGHLEFPSKGSLDGMCPDSELVTHTASDDHVRYTGF